MIITETKRLFLREMVPEDHAALYKEAANAVRDRTFENTPFCEVYSYMKSDNIPSSATAVSIGMSFQSEFTDEQGEHTAVYRLDRAKWLALAGRG